MVFQRDLRGGDPGTQLTDLYRQHSAAVYRFGFHLCGRREDAEDITQFAFLQAHRTLASGTVLEHPRAWLMTAVKRRWLTILRDRHDTPVDPTTLELDDHRDPTHDSGQELRDVRANLWALPEQQHQAFVLRHWSGLSYQEIAEVLGTTPAAVESLLVRARASLLRDRQESGECAGVRRALERDRGLTAQMRDHLSGCVRCRTARTRLAKVAGIAAVLALAPSRHVAEALASTVPGCSASAALSSAGGASGGVTSAAAAGGKLVVALKVATAVGAATAMLAAAHVARLPGPAGLFPGGRSGGHPHASAHTRVAAHSQAGGRRSNAPGPGSRAAGSAHHNGNTGHGRSSAQGKPAGHGRTTGHQNSAGGSGSHGNTSGDAAAAGHGEPPTHPASAGHGRPW